jgi:hypothetical protein
LRLFNHYRHEVAHSDGRVCPCPGRCTRTNRYPMQCRQPRDRVFFDVHEQIVGIRENHGCTSIFEFRTRYSPAEHPDARHKRRRPPSRLKPRTPISARRVRDLSVAVGCNRPPPKRPWSISYLGRGRSRMPPVSSKNAHRPSSSTSMRQPGSVLWATESANHACATSALSISLLATTLPRGSITLNATMRCDYPRRSFFTPFFTARGGCQ